MVKKQTPAICTKNSVFSPQRCGALLPLLVVRWLSPDSSLSMIKISFTETAVFPSSLFGYRKLSLSGSCYPGYSKRPTNGTNRCELRRITTFKGPDEAKANLQRHLVPQAREVCLSELKTMPAHVLQAVLDTPVHEPRQSADMGVPLSMESRQMFFRTASSESPGSEPRNGAPIDRGVQLSTESRAYLFRAPSAGASSKSAPKLPAGQCLEGTPVDVQLQGRKAMVPSGFLARWNRMF